MSVEPNKLDFLVGRMLGELGAAAMLPLVRVGDELGVYRVLRSAGPVTSQELAELTGLDERMLREWLNAHAASEYLAFHPATNRYEMTPEQAMVFADENSPVFMLGGYEIVAGNMKDVDKLAHAFQSGHGLGWHEHDCRLFSGVERFFRASYVNHLLQDWLPALDGMVARLERGAKVADVGCGHGASTLLMAEAFPNSIFYGFDYHAESIDRARAAAEALGVVNVRFEAASAKDFPGEDYDLLAYFDALHDMGDPVGAAERARGALAGDGTMLLVEPAAGDTVAENLNPIGRVYYANSTAVCTPASLSQEVGLALGAQAGPARLSAVLSQGGFTRVRVAMRTPFNLILEARP